MMLQVVHKSIPVTNLFAYQIKREGAMAIRRLYEYIQWVFKIWTAEKRVYLKSKLMEFRFQTPLCVWKPNFGFGFQTFDKVFEIRAWKFKF